MIGNLWKLMSRQHKGEIVCDITMCCNRDCPIRNKCYRYRAVPDDYQSFAFFKWQPVSDTNDEECEYFWRVDEIKDRTIPTDVADNRYDRDWQWEGLKSARQELKKDIE